MLGTAVYRQRDGLGYQADQADFVVAIKKEEKKKRKKRKEKA